MVEAEEVVVAQFTGEVVTPLSTGVVNIATWISINGGPNKV